MTQSVPESVRRDQLSGNFAGLSRSGKKGAETRRKKKEIRLARLFRECAERDHEANLDICPVND